MPPTEDQIEVKFSAPEGSKIEKLTAKIKDHLMASEAKTAGSFKAPAGQWKLRWEIRGKPGGKYQVQVTVNGQQAWSEEMSFDEWGVDNGFYP